MSSIHYPPTTIHLSSPQLGVLGFGLLQDGDVGIRVFPEGEEILIRLANGVLVAHHHLRSARYATTQARVQDEKSKSRVLCRTESDCNHASRLTSDKYYF